MSAPYPDQQAYGGYAPPYPGQQPPYPGGQQPYPPGYPPYQSPNIGFVNPGMPGGYPQQPYPGGYNDSGYPQQPGYPPQPSGPSNAPYMDPEDPGYAKGFGFDDKTIRQGFIKKVYSILSLQLAVTFAFICVFTLNEETKLWSQRNPGVVIACMIASIVFLLIIVCCESARRKSPTNFIFLGLFTIFEGITLGFVTTTYKVETVMYAVGLTALIVVGLTIFAFQTKCDFTVMGSALCILVLILFALSIVGLFFRSRLFEFLIACGGAVIFSLYIIYDTQLMMGGNHKYSISPEEYVFASLNLYLDIINLFLYLLRILRYIQSE